MSTEPTVIGPRLATYIHEVGMRDHPILRELATTTDALAEGGMRSATEQVALLAFLIEAMQLGRILEIGCFTGYATLGMALALPAEGRIVTLDLNEAWAAVGRQHWRRAGVDERIELRLGLAEESLRALLVERGPAAFDLAYIDADKKSYPAYFQLARELIRPGGLIALDNMFWGGGVADPGNSSKQAETLRKLTREIQADPQLAMVLLPIADGLLLVRKR
jgi:O-methyltransferase